MTQLVYPIAQTQWNRPQSRRFLPNRGKFHLPSSILLADADQAVEFLGVKLVGVNMENGKKLLFTLAFVLVLLLLGRVLPALADWLLRGRRNARLDFWTHQAVRLVVTLLFLAGYFVILRGKTFMVGDRISMGGVRGDVIALDFIKTTIMEMGQPPTYSDATSSTWVRGRQYTGRIVTVSNDKVFSEPVYNYSRDFPYVWEEMSLPITYTADRQRAEQIMLETAGRHTVRVRELSEETRQEMERRYFVDLGDLQPKVYYRLTDNWLELTLRFIAEERGVRDLKDAISRDILRAFDEAGISIASATFEIVGLPPLRLQRHREGLPGGPASNQAVT